MSTSPNASTRSAPGTERIPATPAALPDHPFVSVIIPVYNDAERLSRCLATLEAQTYPRARFEVIVIDNGSTDELPAVVAAFARVRVLQEPMPGSYAARNRGLAAAAGEVIAFTDSDCLPDAAWLESGVAALRAVDTCGLIGGAIQVTAQTADRPTVCELYDRVFDFDQERFLVRGRFACTANVFTYASIVREVGAFDGRMRSVGDRDFGNRIAAAGYHLRFAGRAIVSHPARTTVRDLLKKRLRVAGGHHARARKRRFPFLRFVYALAQQLIRNPLSGAARIWRRAGEASHGQKLKVLGLYVFLCWAEALERIRLELGGETRR